MDQEDKFLGMFAIGKLADGVANKKDNRTRIPASECVEWRLDGGRQEVPNPLGPGQQTAGDSYVPNFYQRSRRWRQAVLRNIRRLRK